MDDGLGTGGDEDNGVLALPRGQRKKARTRRAIIDAAKAVLAELGPSGTVQDITNRADVGVGSFYYHFADKQELVDEAVEEAITDFERAYVAATQHLEDPAEKFCARVRLFGRAPELRPETAQIIVRMFPDRSAMGETELGYRTESLVDVETAIGAGRMRSANPQVALVVLLGGSVAVMARRLADPAAGTDLVDDLATMALLVFGLDPDEAVAISHRPLPSMG